MAWQQQLQALRSSITWDGAKDGWNSKWFQGSPGGSSAEPADYVNVLGELRSGAMHVVHWVTLNPDSLTQGTCG